METALQCAYKTRCIPHPQSVLSQTYSDDRFRRESNRPYKHQHLAEVRIAIPSEYEESAPFTPGGELWFDHAVEVRTG